MSDQRDSLTEYAERLLTLQQERGNAVSQADLDRLAHELGFDDEDLKRLRDRSEKDLQRGSQFLKDRMFRRAEKDLRTAFALSPLNLEIQFMLARALMGGGGSTRRREARVLLDDILQKDPHFLQAYDLLKKDRHRKRRIAIVAATFTAVLGLIVVLLIDQPDYNISSTPQYYESPLTEPISPSSTLTQDPIEVVIEKGDGAPILNVKVRESMLNRYGHRDEAAHFLKMDIASQGHSISELQLSVQYEGDRGPIREEKKVGTLLSTRPALLPGDTLPATVVNTFDDDDVKLKRILVSVVNLEATPLGATIESESVPFTLAEGVSGNWSFVVAERDTNHREYDRSGTTHVSSTLVVDNTSPIPVQKALFRVAWLVGDVSLAEANRYFSSSSDPSWLPGQRRVVRFSSQIDQTGLRGVIREITLLSVE